MKRKCFTEEIFRLLETSLVFFPFHNNHTVHTVKELTKVVCKGFYFSEKNMIKYLLYLSTVRLQQSNGPGIWFLIKF